VCSEASSRSYRARTAAACSCARPSKCLDSRSRSSSASDRTLRISAPDSSLRRCSSASSFRDAAACFSSLSAWSVSLAWSLPASACAHLDSSSVDRARSLRSSLCASSAARYHLVLSAARVSSLALRSPISPLSRSLWSSRSYTRPSDAPNACDNSSERRCNAMRSASAASKASPLPYS